MIAVNVVNVENAAEKKVADGTSKKDGEKTQDMKEKDNAMDAFLLQCDRPQLMKPYPGGPLARTLTPQQKSV